jgi:hypothetical protein
MELIRGSTKFQVSPCRNGKRHMSAAEFPSLLGPTNQEVQTHPAHWRTHQHRVDIYSGSEPQEAALHRIPSERKTERNTNVFLLVSGTCPPHPFPINTTTEVARLTTKYSSNLKLPHNGDPVAERAAVDSAGPSSHKTPCERSCRGWWFWLLTVASVLRSSTSVLEPLGTCLTPFPRGQVFSEDSIPSLWCPGEQISEHW